MSILVRDSDALRSRIAGSKHHLSVHAQIDVTMPGWVYVDDHAARSAFACNSEGWYLIGEAHNPPFTAWLRDFLKVHILPNAHDRGEESIPLHFYPDDWQEIAAEILPEQTYSVEYQQYFRFTGPPYTPTQDVPAGCVLRPIDAALLASQDQFPVPRLRDWAMRGFGDLDTFLAAGIGMCLEQDGEIVCWCMPDCAIGDWCELGVHTREGERRKGFAAHTVAATVAGCLARGFTNIGWHCWRGNDASARLAQKVGFTYVLDHPAFLVQTG